MLRDLSAQSTVMGLLAAFVGFASSFAVVLHGLVGAGASEAQAASGLAALSISMGFCAILLSLWTRLPISIAWSTPGAALLAATGGIEGGFPAAVGAFILCALLIVAAGLLKPFGRLVAAIPPVLASAMLAGVLVGLCLAPVKAVAFDPRLGLPIVLAWAVAGRMHRLAAVPAALIAFGLVVALGVEIPANAGARLADSIGLRFEWVTPVFTWSGLITIALPLFVVTMASQNIPGIAVLNVSGYQPAPGRLFAATGVFSLFSAPFGGHAVNLAAITAAMCAGEDAHADPRRRYWAAIVAGVAYIVFGVLAPTITALVALAPAILIEAVAGLALIGAFAGAASVAFREPATREAAAVTFLVTASGVSFAGVSGTFWGLAVGGAMLLIARAGRRV
ncbi:benzoate transporter [Rhizobium rhizosphaerae]|uniref:Benzoate transporter n=1 Tax=Xaviernesmea rhizosphaerae TaxID=1672749 RepID=A0ABX3PH32_9HYPH|nr:benzoate/H(+) symporter BenE family transporter [Xaviernesmea rhizosphaerae]OQP87687.1 benzoate transporter [Xaviernesmea rhizosphaerae]